MINLNYYKVCYRRVYDNFLFSVGIYQFDTKLLRQLCQDSLAQLDGLNQRFLKQDKVSTYYLMLPYQKAIKEFYHDLK